MRSISTILNQFTTATEQMIETAIRPYLIAQLGTPMLEALQTLSLKNILIAGHLLGHLLGLCAVIVLGIVLVSDFLFTRTTAEVMLFCRRISRIVATGLTALWLSGIALLVCYYFFYPEKLQNSHAYAEYFIVIVLTVNSFITSQKALPIMWKYRDRNVLACATINETLLFAVCLGISIVSWIAPVLFAISDESVAQRTSFHQLGQYILALVFVLPLFCAIAFRSRQNSRAASLLSYHGKALATTTAR